MLTDKHFKNQKFLEDLHVIFCLLTTYYLLIVFGGKKVQVKLPEGGQKNASKYRCSRAWSKLRNF